MQIDTQYLLEQSTIEFASKSYTVPGPGAAAAARVQGRGDGPAGAPSPAAGPADGLSGARARVRL